MNPRRVFSLLRKETQERTIVPRLPVVGRFGEDQVQVLSSTTPPQFALCAQILGLEPEQMTAWSMLREKLGFSVDEATKLLLEIGPSWSVTLSEFLEVCDGTPDEVVEALRRNWPRVMLDG